MDKSHELTVQPTSDVLAQVIDYNEVYKAMIRDDATFFRNLSDNVIRDLSVHQLPGFDSILSYYVEFQNYNMIEVLLSRGWLLSSVESLIAKCLTERPNYEIVRLLLKYGYKPSWDEVYIIICDSHDGLIDEVMANLPSWWIMINHRQLINTIVHYNRLQWLLALVRHGYTLKTNYPVDLLRSPCWMATRSKQVDILNYLIEHDVHKDIKSEQRHVLWFEIIQSGDTSLITAGLNLFQDHFISSRFLVAQFSSFLDVANADQLTTALSYLHPSDFQLANHPWFYVQNRKLEALMCVLEEYNFKPQTNWVVGRMFAFTFLSASIYVACGLSGWR
jgi:hypothetical protein